MDSEDGREAANVPGGRPSTDEYYERFIESRDIDWEELIRENPEAQEDLRALARIDGIRTAYESQEFATGPRTGETRGDGFGPDEPGGVKVRQGDTRRDEAGKESATPETGEGDHKPRRKRRPKRFGDYEIIERVGKGGFASIYRARDEKAGREVALKILRSRKEISDDVVARFLREARALARLDHENIVRIYHVIDQNNALGLCMELISGKSLSQLLEERGPFPVEEVVDIAIDLCSALEEVHRIGFVHRDVKAENIMRDENGRTVLMDFGISRSRNPTRRVTAMGVLVGTPLAMAPEQYEFKPVDSRTDIYALGCLLYRLITGEYPIHGSSMEEIRRNVLEGHFPRIRELRPAVPQELEEIVQRAMEKDQRDRYQSAAEMEHAVRRWAGKLPAPTTAGAVSQSSKGYPRLIVVLLVAILLALLAVIVLLLTGD